MVQGDSHRHRQACVYSIAQTRVRSQGQGHDVLRMLFCTVSPAHVYHQSASPPFHPPTSLIAKVEPSLANLASTWKHPLRQVAADCCARPLHLNQRCCYLPSSSQTECHKPRRLRRTQLTPAPKSASTLCYKICMAVPTCKGYLNSNMGDRI